MIQIINIYTIHDTDHEDTHDISILISEIYTIHNADY